MLDTVSAATVSSDHKGRNLLMCPPEQQGGWVRTHVTGVYLDYPAHAWAVQFA